MQKDKLIQLLQEKNICTYYVIPLMRITPTHLGGETNVLNSYLSKDHKKLVVKVSNHLYVDVTKIPTHTVTTYETDVYYIFTIPNKFLADVELISQGKYSLITSMSKNMIKKFSELKNSEQSEDELGISKQVTSIWLLALNRSVTIKSMWENTFGITLEDDSEVLSSPTKLYLPEDFWSSL